MFGFVLGVLRWLRGRFEFQGGNHGATHLLLGVVLFDTRGGVGDLDVLWGVPLRAWVMYTALPGFLADKGRPGKGLFSLSGLSCFPERKSWV